MGAEAFIATALLSGYSTYMSYEAQEKAARDAARASQESAQNARERAALAEKIAREKHETEIGFAEARIEFEEGIALEETEYVIKQIAKRDAEIRAAAITGFSASGVDPFEEGSSASAVVKRIESESEIEQGRVRKGFETFMETREFELGQLKESRAKTFDWFMQQTQFELEYEVSSRLAEARSYKSQAGYAGAGRFLGTGSALLSGYTGYKTHQLLIQ